MFCRLAMPIGFGETGKRRYGARDGVISSVLNPTIIVKQNADGALKLPDFGTRIHVAALAADARRPVWLVGVDVGVVPTLEAEGLPGIGLGCFQTSRCGSDLLLSLRRSGVVSAVSW